MWPVPGRSQTFHFISFKLIFTFGPRVAKYLSERTVQTLEQKSEGLRSSRQRRFQLHMAQEDTGHPGRLWFTLNF